MKKIVFGFMFVFFPGSLWALDLDYSTYLGGSGDDVAYSMAIDSEYNIYLAGDTFSLDFPTQDPFRPGFNSATDYYADVFVSKLDSDGAGLIFSTYLGGAEEDGSLGAPVYKMGLAVDDVQCVYITGMTTSENFPTLNPYQAADPGYANAFLTKFDSTGSSLIYSTYLGGGGNDYGCALALDSNRCVYVTGATGSSAFPTLDAFQPAHGGGNDDAFLTKFHSDGSSLIYSTYLGGDGHDDSGYALIVDSLGCAYVTGECDSSNFPTLNPFDPSLDGYSDVFLTKFASSGSSLVYSTYLGGSSFDTGFAITIDSDYCAYLTGSTVSDDFPTLNAYQDAHVSNEDIFVTKFASAGSSLIFSTYLAGSGWETGRGIALDGGRFIYITGDTNSTDFPLKDPYQDKLNQGLSDIYPDAFAAKLCCMGNILLYSTYLGGPENDEAYALALDAEHQELYLAGETGSDNFPVVSAFQGSRAGQNDAFVAKLGNTPSILVIPDGDYNGDGTDDLAIYRPADGLWLVKGITRVYFGKSADTPAPADYDGDGTCDIAYFRPGSGLWKIRNNTQFYYGLAGDKAVPNDYDGDGSCDIGIFRDSTARWMVRGITDVYFGKSGDIPVPGDYDGDGDSDLAYFRGGTTLWKIKDITQFYFGRRNDRVVSADYSGDGTIRPAVYRPLVGAWIVRGITRNYFGGCADLPVPADYSGAGTAQLGFFSSYRSLWKLDGLTRIYFGRNGDIPITR